MKNLILDVKFVYMRGFGDGYDLLGGDKFAALDCDLISSWWIVPTYGIGFIYGKIKKVFVRQK